MITTSIDGAIGRVIIDRPDKRNAMSCAMWAALPGAIDGLGRDERVRIILLEGRGPDFSAGADISEFETVYADRAAAAAFAATLAAAMDAVAASTRPTLAVVRGHCIGSAVGLALCCDLRFAAASSRFAITPARLGLAYSFEDTRRLVQAIGSSAAKDLLMTSRTIDADEALRLRLVDRVCDETDLAAEAQVYADLVRAASQTSIGIARDFVDRVGRGQRLEDDETRTAYLDAVEGRDFVEGLQAFRARRPPRFS